MPSWRRIGATLPAVTPLTRDVFDGATAERRLADYFAVATTAAFGALSRLELTAAAACITYVERTQLGKRPPLSPPARESAGATLSIDAATRANLELIATLSGERRGSLLAAIDRTVTAAGARLLAQRLAAPLTDPDAISARLDAVGALVADTTRRARACASSSRAARTSRARWRGWCSDAAARAISPRSATGFARPPAIGGGARRAGRSCRRRLPRRAQALARVDRRDRAMRWPPRWPTNCRAQARRRLRPRGL